MFSLVLIVRRIMIVLQNLVFFIFYFVGTSYLLCHIHHSHFATFVDWCKLARHCILAET